MNEDDAKDEEENNLHFFFVNVKFISHFFKLFLSKETLEKICMYI